MTLDVPPKGAKGMPVAEPLGKSFGGLSHMESFGPVEELLWEKQSARRSNNCFE